MSQKKSELIEIGALWEGRKPGVMTGKMGNARCVILPNDRRDSDNQPAARIFIAPPLEKKHDGDTPF